MGDHAYPAPEHSKLVKRLRLENQSNIRRDWIGNDKSAKIQTGVVDLRESPLRLRLSWRKSPTDPVRPVGVFDLDLGQLLSAGFIRSDPSGKQKIRLRFYHAQDGLIYIQVNSDEPKLPIGTIGS